jgi:hypothetical protein
MGLVIAIAGGFGVAIASAFHWMGPAAVPLIIIVQAFLAVGIYYYRTLPPTQWAGSAS